MAASPKWVEGKYGKLSEGDLTKVEDVVLQALGFETPAEDDEPKSA